MPEISDAELRQFVRYQNFGTPEEVQKKISDLETDNRKYRQETIPALEARVPKDSEVVVPKAKADLLPKYEKLGKPEEIEGKISEGEKARVALAQKEKKDTALKFAKASGLAEEAVETLITLEVLNGASFEVRKGKVKDKNTGAEVEGDVGYIKLAGENQKEMTFAEAREQIPALKGLAVAGPTAERKGVSFVKQGGSVEGGDTSVYARIRASREAEKTAAKDKPPTKTIEERLGMTR